MYRLVVMDIFLPSHHPKPQLLQPAVSHWGKYQCLPVRTDRELDWILGKRKVCGGWGRWWEKCAHCHQFRYHLRVLLYQGRDFGKIRRWPNRKCQAQNFDTTYMSSCRIVGHHLQAKLVWSHKPVPCVSIIVRPVKTWSPTAPLFLQIQTFIRTDLLTD